ncbi:GNAT family N-acetyltransferase [Campylobacter sp. RM16187]|uniref:GNAT family N-acetyltransferase n=1 Tax=Campylobacter sp. RM16187 TaxID=1660063 RepID=UPI0021B5ADE4|nr:GNAT family N-acetyltransferase [Campylobacter sp. RM16187]QKG28404.1 putative acetyltransferase [Campylobacter sp. RM16187]
MTIRKATKNDAKAIIEMINELALYEKLESEVKIDESVFVSHIFEKELASALVAVSGGGEIVGYAIFFHSFSTFLGRAGIYLEDLYVKKKFRGQGIGMKFIKTLAEICEDEGFGRLEWECLDWNEPSIKFYESLGAKRQNGWLKFRMSREEIEKISKI